MSNQSSWPQGASILERMMGIGDIERRIIRSDPQLRLAISFQFGALVFCPPFLAYAVYKVAVSLFGMSSAAALVLAGSVAFGLFIIDRLYLAELRGDASATARRAGRRVAAEADPAERQSIAAEFPVAIHMG